jgi:hypothetical protein
LELRHLARREQPIVEFGRLGRHRERQGRLPEPLDVAGHQAVGGEIDDTVIGKPRAFHRRLARRLPQVDVTHWRPKLGRDCLQFVGRVGQSRQSRKPRSIGLGASPIATGRRRILPGAGIGIRGRRMVLRCKNRIAEPDHRKFNSYSQVLSFAFPERRNIASQAELGILTIW